MALKNKQSLLIALLVFAVPSAGWVGYSYGRSSSSREWSDYAAALDKGERLVDMIKADDEARKENLIKHHLGDEKNQVFTDELGFLNRYARHRFQNDLEHNVPNYKAYIEIERKAGTLPPSIESEGLSL